MKIVRNIKNIKIEYFWCWNWNTGINKLIAWLLMPWPHVLPYHQKPWTCSWYPWRMISPTGAIAILRNDRQWKCVLVWSFHKQIERNNCWISGKFCSVSFVPLIHRWKLRLTLISAWICTCIQYKVGDEITYPFSNFNGEVWEWISNFIPCTLYLACDYLCMLGLKLINVRKRVPVSFL